MSGGNWRDNPQVGMVIKERNPRHRFGHIPRRIIGVQGDRIETAGMSGGQRNGWMSRASLSRYDLVPSTSRQSS